MNRFLAITSVVVAANLGCIVHTVRPQPPPGQPAAQRMTYDEAVNRSTEYARSRGYLLLKVKDAHLTGRDVWKVKLDVARPGAGMQGKLHLELDAWSREVLRADEDLKPGHEAWGHMKEDHGHEHEHGNFHDARAIGDDD